MSENDRQGLMNWLGFREPFDYSKARWLGRIVSGVMILLVGVLFILAVASAVAMLSGAVFGDASLTPGNSLGVGAVTVALISAPFVIWRSVVAQKSVDVQEQGQITDRINKAVEGLGAEKTVRLHRKDSNGNFLFHEKEGSQGDTKSDLDFKRPVIVELSEPNLEVRIGAIYALERISQDSARDHIQIMEILCAYIRQNAGREDVPLPEGDLTPQEWKVWARQGSEHLRSDVDTALKVIERRRADRKRLEKDRDDPYRLGLERAPFRKIILAGRDLTSANLEEVDLRGADVSRANLQGANLSNALLQGANISDAQLNGAILIGTQLQGALLGDAALRGAFLWRTQLQGTVLWGANLQGAILRDTTLQDVTLEGATFQGAKLEAVEFEGHIDLARACFRGAGLRYINLSSAPEISPHVIEFFGDASVTLPGGLTSEHESWPAHWPRHTLRTVEFNEEWLKWQADPENYVPPEAS